MGKLAIPLGFVLPLLVYLWAAWNATRPGAPPARRGVLPARLVPVLFALGLAALSGLVAALLAASRATWPESTEVAWTGVRSARTNVPLRIGGDREGAAYGWPNGSFAPEVKASLASAGKARLEVSGGGALVAASGKAVNGVAVAYGERKKAGAFEVGLVRDGLLGRGLVITDETGAEVARVRLTRPHGSRVRALLPRLQRHLNDLRASGEAVSASLALGLEDWARDTAFLFPERNVLHVVRRGPEDTGSVEVALPAHVTVHWPGLTLHGELTTAGEGLVKLRFLPPWKLASPLPPADRTKGGLRRLVVTGSPEPDDQAFVLPLGAAVSDPRRVLELAVEAEGRALFSGGAAVARETGAGDEATRRILGQKPRATQPPAVAASPEKAGSSIEVIAAGAAFELHTLRDLPVPSAILLAYGLGLALLAYGLLRLSRRVWERDLWVAGGLLVAVWDLVALRLLLALRYVADPRSLDEIAVKGLTTALGALVLVPAALVAAVVLFRTQYAPIADLSGLRRAMGSSFAYWALVGAAALVAVSLPLTLLPNLPERLRPGLAGSTTAIVAVLGLLLLAAQLTSHVASARAVLPPEELGELRLLGLPARLFLLPYRAVYGWGRGAATLLRSIASGGGALRGVSLEVRPLLVAAAFALVALGIASWLMRELLPNVLQDIVAPFLAGGLVGLAWLALAVWLEPGDVSWRSPRAWLGVAVLSAVTLLLPAYVLPWALDDVGGVFASLSFLVPLLLVVALSRAGKAGWVGLGVVVLGAVAAYNALFVVGTLVPGAFERGRARITVFREGPSSQRFLPDTEGPGTARPRGVTFESLRDAIEHNWENEAIAHEGGAFGAGYGRAPDHLSQVRRDTLQFDSTFSFYVVGDHGLLGGFTLLLLYGVPLGLVLASARRRFDAGHGLAAALAATLWNEALVHACMDFGGLPFTGRNLPLLSVNSNTDALRWALLLALLAQALFWRTTGDDELMAPAENGESILPAGPDGEPSPARVQATTALLVAPSVLFFLALVVRPGVRILLDPLLDEPFTWGPLLARVDEQLEKGEIGFDASTGMLTAPKDGGGRTLLDLEVARYNALPRGERLPEPPSLAGPLSRVATLAEYDSVLASFRRPPASGRRAPSLFRVEMRRALVDSDDPGAPAWRLEQVYEARANPDYDVRLSFKERPGPATMPRTVLKRPGGADLLLVGPAWVMGRWRAVASPRSPLPWAPNLASALKEEWGKLAPKDAARALGQLTLDPDLTAAAQRFAAEKARSLHAQRLAERRSARAWRGALPPRVALSVMDAGNGEIVALGGWPRMTPSRDFRRDDGGEWLPPARWLDDVAVPAELRTRYQGERCFENVEVGSASKPLWAAAALQVHQEIDRDLMVKGPDFENELFGVEVSDKGWHVTASGWRGFEDYLALSDNRYQIRLGFLGLAETDGHGHPRGAAVTGGTRESLAGSSPEPWGRFPAFPASLGFSPEKPRVLRNVQGTALAKAMRELFGAGVAAGDATPGRLAFWSGQEAPAARHGGSALGALTPAPVNLRLDTVGSPRDFVSVLVGGRENRWSAVALGSAFTTCVTGLPVVPHLARNVETKTPRPPIPVTAARLRPGLAACVGRGTARGPLGAAAHDFLASLDGVEAYAKTGTLSTGTAGIETSRIVLSLVRWDDGRVGRLKTGLTFSVVAERARQGLATEWLGEFLVANRELVRWHLFPETKRPLIAERALPPPAESVVTRPTAPKKRPPAARPGTAPRKPVGATTPARPAPPKPKPRRP